MLEDKKYDHNIFFIPTKASPNPVKNNYLKRKCLEDRLKTTFLLQQKLDDLREKADADFGVGMEFANAASGRVWDDDKAKMCSYKELINHLNPKVQQKWIRSGENEFGRLFRGFQPNDIEGIGVLDWIKRSEVPMGKKVTYPRYTVAVRPEKDEPDRTRITCGGNLLDYFGDVTTHTASMETVKMHWNSVLSTPGAKYCTGDISNMYLMSLLPEAEYVRFQYELIPPRIIEYYNLDELVIDGYVYARINRAWYGLKQGGKIAHDDLVQHLNEHGYVRAGTTEGLFRHVTRDISFTLIVDDFGIKYQCKEDVDHLNKIMGEKYIFKVDFKAK